jgi:Uma2 family endonuclease
MLANRGIAGRNSSADDEKERGPPGDQELTVSRPIPTMPIARCPAYNEVIMSTATTQPLTVEEFDRLDLSQGRNWELHDGEVVEVPFPLFVHRLIQMRVVALLGPLFPYAQVVMECPFQAGDHDKRSADVAVVSQDRAQAARQQGILSGAPELVVEVLSPSNSVMELKRYRRLCLNNGTALFLVIDPEDNTVEAFTQGTKVATYTVEDSLPVVLLDVNSAIPVAQIFQGITLTP